MHVCLDTNLPSAPASIRQPLKPPLFHQLAHQQSAGSRRQRTCREQVVINAYATVFRGQHPKAKKLTFIHKYASGELWRYNILKWQNFVPGRELGVGVSCQQATELRLAISLVIANAQSLAALAYILRRPSAQSISGKIAADTYGLAYPGQHDGELTPRLLGANPPIGALLELDTLLPARRPPHRWCPLVICHSLNYWAVA